MNKTVEQYSRNHLVWNWILTSALTGAMAGLQIACAKSPSSAVFNKTAEIATDNVIGGQKADQETPFAKQVMYLAMGVQIEKTPTSTNVSWNGHCTASAISKKIVLTAAHCVQNTTAGQVYLITNQNPENEALNLSQWYAVKSMRIHKDYVGTGRYANDLALLLLEKELPAERVSKLAKIEDVKPERGFIVAGYGLTTDLSDPKFQEASPADGLNHVMKKLEPFQTSDMFLSINQNDHAGFCNGDSGGPGLIFDPKAKEYLVLGVVSNTSMYEAEDKQLDPHEIYSLCIGTGNYTNTVNPSLATWIESTKLELENPTAPNIAEL
jgi:secreted trypsin-like serine protease